MNNQRERQRAESKAQVADKPLFALCRLPPAEGLSVIMKKIAPVCNPAASKL
jgi:hypothetical protein